MGIPATVLLLTHQTKSALGGQFPLQTSTTGRLRVCGQLKLYAVPLISRTLIRSPLTRTSRRLAPEPEEADSMRRIPVAYGRKGVSSKPPDARVYEKLPLSCTIRIRRLKRRHPYVPESDEPMSGATGSDIDLDSGGGGGIVKRCGSASQGSGSG